MLITIGFAIVGLVVLALTLLPARAGRNTGLGWVSERWIAEYRAGQSSAR